MSSTVESGEGGPTRPAAAAPSAPATAGATPPGSVTLANSTSQAPSRCSWRRVAAASTASRVLPTPPGPISVTSRLERTASLSSWSSALRPTKLLNRSRRLPVAIGAGTACETCRAGCGQ